MRIQMMVATIAKWENSQEFRILQSLAKEIHVAEEAEIDLGVVDGTLVIKH